MIREWKNGTDAFQYEEKSGEITILSWKGMDRVARIPEEIEGTAVVGIGRKAFLSNKRVQEIFLPESVERIDDWAFAYCSKLKWIQLPHREIKFGKGVFLECVLLDSIVLVKNGDSAFDSSIATCIGHLLAAVIYKLDDPYLLDLPNVGTTEWFRMWDQSMLRILKTPDMDGYSKTILCGEEDYGSMENNLEFFLSQKRKSKARLAMLRLMNNWMLSNENKSILEKYLLQYTKGCEQEEAWLVLKTEHATETDYYDLFFQIGAISESNFDRVLSDMGAELAEVKAYLLRKKEELWGENSFFESLSLDL